MLTMERCIIMNKIYTIALNLFCILQNSIHL